MMKTEDFLWEVNGFLLNWKYVIYFRSSDDEMVWVFSSEQDDWTDEHRGSTLPYTNVKVEDCDWEKRYSSVKERFFWVTYAACTVLDDGMGVAPPDIIQFRVFIKEKKSK